MAAATDVIAPAQRHTILVVDDTPQNLSLISDLLDGLYNVKLAPSGARALRIVAAGPPDLILLDIMMPEMDGYEVCKALKDQAQTKDIPVIFLTAMDAMEDEEKGLSLGAVDYIAKPISPSILLARIRNQLALKDAADELREQNAQLEDEKSRTRELLRKLKEAADKLVEHNRAIKNGQEDARRVLRRLGSKYRAMGNLEVAWDLLRECPADDDLISDLRELAVEFETRQQFEQSAAVFQHLAGTGLSAPSLPSEEAGAARPDQVMAGPLTDTSPPSAEFVVPNVLGRYHVHKQLGKGAMGSVYLGSDPVIGRIVAIKTMAIDGAFVQSEASDVKARFFREAESAGSLAHPNIVAIYDAGEAAGLCYIAMELLKGRDLSTNAVRSNLLPIERLLTIATRVADALAYAHGKGVVHRDIKPGNIMYDNETDSVKVTDFGIATVTSSSRTDGGLLMGTPPYLSPEQIGGRPVDHRADLYALGVTIYLLACGEYPFQGATVGELLQSIADQPPRDIREFAPQLPECLMAIVARAMDKDPDRRFQTGEEMSKALDLCRRSLSVFS